MQHTPQLKSEAHQSVCVITDPTRHVPDLTEDVRNGLLQPPRSLPPKYFYDAYGSQLFEEICATWEYYLTRTEDSLLTSHSVTIIERTLPSQILEFGSGSAQKTRRLFDACEKIDHACHYAPFDMCESILEETSGKLETDYDWLNVTPLLGDYHAGLGNLPMIDGTRLFVFLGSTIGNFTPEAAVDFITEIKHCMKPGDYLLLGADRIKDTHILDAAYNDAKGITAKFNLNVLSVINHELEADFDLSGFDHHAEFNEILDRIEMHLVSNRKQEVFIGKLNETTRFEAGDEILTEISHKYTFDGLEVLLTKCGLNIVQHHEPENQYFSLILSQVCE
jgi:L-histidine N-alpha-methyltransferase